MKKVLSRDGTPIAFELLGEGRPHMVTAKAQAPMLLEFFNGRA
jgi:hypothetical protein